MRIRFGTDGWRGVIADDFTFSNVRVCAQGVAAYLQRAGKASGGVIIGYDTRFGSRDFAVAAAEVVAANGIPVHFCGKVAPTPVISFAVKERGAGGAIIITASHNPGRYNGFKFRPDYAGAASGEIIAQVQSAIDAVQENGGEARRLTYRQSLSQGLIHEFDPRPAYFARLAELVRLDRIRLSPLRVAVDSMYGAGMGYFSALLDGGEIVVDEVHGEPNPLFPDINAPEPGPHNLAALRALVMSSGAHIGLATDGDADRLALVDERGRSLDNFEVYPLLLHYLLAVQNARGAVIKTVATSSMVDRVAEHFGVPVHMTGVGFKHIAPAMMALKAMIGGEESGGYAFGDHIPERDGILAGLRVIDMLVQSREPLSVLLEKLRTRYGRYFYRKRDLPFSEALREQVESFIRRGCPDKVAGIPVAHVFSEDGLRLELTDGSWVLLRLSGTEPVVRILAESSSEVVVTRILDDVLGLLGLPA